MIYKSQKQFDSLQKQGNYLQKFNKEIQVFKTEEDRQKVIDLYNSGLSCNQIAKIYNCSKLPVLKILKNTKKRKPGEYSNHISKTQGYGESHHSWKGGMKDIYNQFRDLKRYWNWRKEVLDRDKNQCTSCNTSIKLHAHHLVTLKSLILDYCNKNEKSIDNLSYKDLNSDYFFDTNNGLTLCEVCHKKWHKDHGR